MGKSEEDKGNYRSDLTRFSSPSSTETSGIDNNVDVSKCHLIIEKIFRPRCIASLVLGLAVLLSAVFWFPPFLRHQEEDDPGNVDFGSNYEANIVASFLLQRSVYELRANNQKLCYDIFDEIRIPNSSVSVIGLKALPESNWTDVVVGIKPYPTNSAIPSTNLSTLRSYFVSMVIQQSALNLTPSLFGNASFFQVLEFPGGITIIPPQSAFLLQKVQILFNFTLNLSIFQVQIKTDELKVQMAKGLHLSSNENLYFRYTNLLGSTVFPPVIVQTAVVPVVGSPSISRLKELAQTVAGSPRSNLGLNHTIFGQVKQVHFSSFLQSSSSTSMGNDITSSPAPAPAPQSMPDHQHQKKKQNHPVNLAIQQTPPAPPPGCRFGFNWKFHNSRTQFTHVPTPLGHQH